MSDDEAPENEADEEEETQELSWEQGRSYGERLRNSTKEYVIETYDEHGDKDGELVFEYGQLSTSDKSRIQDEGVTTRTTGRDANVEVDSEVITRETLKRGIKEGPPGFTPNNQCVREFMNAFPDHAEELTECIQNFSEMEPEVRDRFRQGRTG